MKKIAAGILLLVVLGWIGACSGGEGNHRGNGGNHGGGRHGGGCH